MRKLIKVVTLAAAIAMIGSLQAFASSYKIGTVTIGFNETAEDAGVVREAEPYVRTSGCEITDWSCSHDYADWKPGNKVTFNIKVEATGDHHFSTTDTKIKMVKDNAELSSKTIKPSKINLKVNYWPTITLGTPENLVWDDDDEYVAKWDKVEYCNAYEVKIKIETDEDHTKTKTVTVTKPEIDLSSYATTGDVTFQVRAVPKNNSQKKYYKESAWVDMNDVAVASTENTANGLFNENKSGDRTFTLSEGGNATGWQYLNGNWYYFDPTDGNKASTNKWMLINDNWFHFDSNSIMESGWVKPNTEDGLWYYLNNDLTSPDFGKMQTGWISKGPAGPDYYLNDGSVADLPLGACLTNTTTPDGYQVDASGAWYRQ